ncbi:MAG: YbhB/YbcL family Raf kinase inhibitor-like protein [Thermoplasmata archaeon]
MAFRLESPEFKHGESIPKKFTCDGADVSPALRWSDVPVGTRSFALICDDPDAPMGTWVHWVIYNIPGDRTGISENVPKQSLLPDGTKQGSNSWRKTGYGGPCPPGKKPHRYFFKLMALDTMVQIPAGASKDELLRAVGGHVLGEAELVGLYGR